MKKVGVIDYGTGNLKSVVKAFEHLGAEVSLIHVSKDADEVDALVFPGQGTFDQCMGSLKQTGLDNLIKKWVAEDKPYFGICLGLQVLFCSSEEGSRKGLGLFDGKVKRFRLGIEYKIPHMGWNEIKVQNSSSVFRNLADNNHAYFIHSYEFIPNDKKIVSLTTNYGKDVVAAISFKNIYGAQFHPEKSQNTGIKILTNFLNL